MAKVKHIQVNELPTQLEANAIYFVRNTGEIWQTDSNGIGIKMGVGFTGYNDLKPELKSTVNATITNNVADIEMNKAVAFQLTELTADTTINFKNLQENKQVKLYIKGNFALTFTAENSVPVITDNISYNGNSWNIIVAEISKVDGSLQINLISLQ